jgi:hypothetical protein
MFHFIISILWYLLFGWFVLFCFCNLYKAKEISNHTVEEVNRIKETLNGYCSLGRYYPGINSKVTYLWSEHLKDSEIKENKKEEIKCDFGRALELLKLGKKVCRLGWNGKGQYIAIQKPDKNSADTLPYLYIITVDKKRVPWLASQTDILSQDWIEKE